MYEGNNPWLVKNDPDAPGWYYLVEKYYHPPKWLEWLGVKSECSWERSKKNYPTENEALQAARYKAAERNLLPDFS